MSLSVINGLCFHDEFRRLMILDDDVSGTTWKKKSRQGFCEVLYVAELFSVKVR